jgi:NAD(P)-dependent dehydrogenase (short-subunit alcohol dehydrogenase family)
VYAGVHSTSKGLENIPNVRVLPLDVTDGASLQRAAEEISAAGDARLQGVINNAGIIVQGPLELVPEEELRRQFDVNVVGPALVAQTFLPFLRRGRGRLINVTAASARLPGPFFGPISASKAALAALSDAWRVELAHWGIPVVVIEPGAFETEIFAKAATAAQKAAAALPSQQLALYRPQQEAVDAAMGAMKLSPPSMLADSIVRAVTTSRPKPRYTVGPDVRLLGLASRLPLRLRDSLVRRLTGLHKVPPAVR